MDIPEATQIQIVIGLAGIAVFFALRELMCWYWKINQIVALLQRIADKLAPEEKNDTAAEPKPE